MTFVNLFQSCKPYFASRTRRDCLKISNYPSIRHNEGKKCSRYQSSAVFIKCNISCIVQFHAYNSRRNVALRGRETGILLIALQEPYSILFLVCSALCVTCLFLLMLKSLMVFSFTQQANSDMEKIEKKIPAFFYQYMYQQIQPPSYFYSCALSTDNKKEMCILDTILIEYLSFFNNAYTIFIHNI